MTITPAIDVEHRVIPATAPQSPNPRATEDDAAMIEAYIEHLRRLDRSPETIKLRRSLLYRLASELEYGVGETTTEELAEWLHRDGWSRGTRSTYFTGLRSFYGWATRPRDQWVSFDPTIDLEAVPSSRGFARPVTDAELAHILTNAREPYRTWSKIAAYNGLRCVEISGLDREHVNAQQLIVVRGKGGKPRVHDTDPYVWAAVRDLPTGPIARKRTGERANANYVSVTASEHFQSLGLKDVTMHRLRHWLGVTTQRLYRDIRVTQAVLGHKALSSTQIYTDATVEQQRAARAMLPRLAG